MKNKILLLFAFLSALVILSGTPPGVMAAERNFPAGSLIIPMDSFYQPDGDNGILEAYGLVFYLLKNNLAIYWVVNEDKATIAGVDFVIEVDELEEGVDAVARLYDHAGGATDLTFNNGAGDGDTKVSYVGAPFVIEKSDADAAKVIINKCNWSAVNVHEAKVPFKAPVLREMRGTPPPGSP